MYMGIIFFLDVNTTVYSVFHISVYPQRSIEKIQGFLECKKTVVVNMNSTMTGYWSR